MKYSSDSQSGNVLWFILLAVALLGFLTIVVTRSGSSVEQTGSIEQARIKASALMRYAKSVETAVTQMRSNGTSENSIDFITLGASYDNASCTDPSCEVFHVNGGGITYQSAGDVLNDRNFAQNWVVTAANRVGGMGCDDNTDDCRDLLMLVRGMPDTICLQVNAILRVENPSGTPPSQANLGLTPEFDGSFTPAGANNLIGGAAANQSPQVKNRAAGCIYHNSENIFFQVLIPR